MPITIVRSPTAVHTLNQWEASHGIGTEVSVVTDASDGTSMGNINGGAFEDLLYEFQKIDAPDSCPIVSCVLTMRVLYPDAGAIMFSRARVGGVLHAGAPHTAGGGTPTTLTETDEWAGVVTTVGRFNATQFGCYANWSSGPPALVFLGASVTYVPPVGGFVSLVLSTLPSAIGTGALLGMV
jgi:hypothetical protein